MAICASPGSFTNYMEESILKHVLHIASYASPPKVYAGLGDYGDGQDDEITGAGYERQRILFTAPSTDTEGVTSIQNECDLYFGPAEADWPSFTHVGIYDAREAGNLLAYCTLPDAFSVDEDQQLFFLASEIDIRMTKGTIQLGRWSKYLQEKVLDHIFRGKGFSMPDVYGAITETVPSFDATGSDLTEPDTADGYARPGPGISFSTPAQYLMGYAAAYVDEAAGFGVALTDWFPMPDLQTGLVYCDAATGGNILFIAGTSIFQEVLEGDSPYIHDAEDYNQVGIH